MDNNSDSFRSILIHLHRFDSYDLFCLHRFLHPHSPSHRGIRGKKMMDCVDPVKNRPRAIYRWLAMTPQCDCGVVRPAQQYGRKLGGLWGRADMHRHHRESDHIYGHILLSLLLVSLEIGFRCISRIFSIFPPAHSGTLSLRCGS